MQNAASPTDSASLLLDLAHREATAYWQEHPGRPASLEIGPHSIAARLSALVAETHGISVHATLRRGTEDDARKARRLLCGALAARGWSEWWIATYFGIPHAWVKEALAPEEPQESVERPSSVRIVTTGAGDASSTITVTAKWAVGAPRGDTVFSIHEPADDDAEPDTERCPMSAPISERPISVELVTPAPALPKSRPSPRVRRAVVAEVPAKDQRTLWVAPGLRCRAKASGVDAHGRRLCRAHLGNVALKAKRLAAMGSGR